MFKGVGKAVNKVLVIVLLALLLASFAIWGVGDIFRDRGAGNKVAIVGDIVIGSEELKKAVSYEVNNLQQQFGAELPPEMLKAFGIEKRALDLLINRKLLVQAARDAGIEIGERQIIDMIRSDPGFYDQEGKFSKDAFKTFLNKIGYTEQQFYNDIRSDMATDILVNSINGGPILVSDMVQKLHTYEAEQREAKVLVIPANYIKDVANPGQEELTSYFEKEKQNFRAPEYRSATYLLLNTSNVMANIDTSDQKLHEEYESNIHEYEIPERRGIEQMIFSDMETAQSAYNMLQEKKDFYQVAEEKAKLKRKEVLLGDLSKDEFSGGGLLSEDAVNKVFALNKDEYTEPVESKIGVHIFRVVKIEPSKTESFENVKEEVKKRIIESRAADLLATLANKIQDEIAAGAKVEEIGSKLGIEAKKVKYLTKEGNVKGGDKANVPEFGKFIESVFTLEPGAVSDVTSADDGLSYYVARVDEVVPERDQAMDEVKGEVTKSWREFKKQEKLLALAEKTAKDAKEGNLQKVAEGLKLKTENVTAIYRDENAKLPGQLVAELFSIKNGATTGAYQKQEGSYAIAELSKVVPASNDDPVRPLEQTRMVLADQMGNDIIGQYIGYLHGKYRVKKFTAE